MNESSEDGAVIYTAALTGFEIVREIVGESLRRSVYVALTYIPVGGLC